MPSTKHSWFSAAGIAALILSVLQFNACSSSSGGSTSIGPNDPFTGLAVSQTINIPKSSLQYPVEVIRDVYGIPHIYGRTMTDVAFAQGYVQASDRLFEMDMFRHIGDGTLTEYLGNMPGIVDEDIHSRILGFSTIAPIVYAQSSPQIQSVLTSFCNGINTYLDQLKLQVQNNPNVKVLPYEYSQIGITVTAIKPFTPMDIIAFGKYMSYSLSGEDDGTKIALTSFLDNVKSVFAFTATDTGLRHFTGLTYDIVRSEPAAKAPAVPLPNPFAKATTTSLSTLGMLPPVMSSVNQHKTVISPVSLQGAMRFYNSIYDGPMGALFRPQPLGKKGSNNWTIGPALTTNHYAMLANDTHLQLFNPPIFYEVHDNTEAVGNGNIDVAGVVFPLAPGVIVGHNDAIAWGVTVFGPDIIDIYQFTVTTGSPDTVGYDGWTLPITTVPLTLTFGGLFNGNKITTGTVNTYYVTIQGMGSLPIIPGSYIPGNPTSAALALTWTGFLPSNELGAFYGIDQAQDLSQFIAAQSDFKLGAQNFVYADISGNIYLTDQCTIPVRASGTSIHTTVGLPYTGLTYENYEYPPYLVLPGGSAFTWTGFLSAAAVPFTTNPSVGYIATANQDTVGVTYNNEPLENPNYLGAFFDPGFRAKEINDDINANEPNIDFNVIQNKMQADHTDTYAKRIMPFLQTAYNYFTANSLTVTPMETQAMGYLNQWTFDTPTGISETTQQVNDSIATSIYEGFAQALFQDVYKDKFAALGITDPPGIVEFNLVTSLLKALEYPTETALYSPVRNQSMLFDKLVLNGGGYTYTTRTVNQVMMESLQAGLNELSSNVFKTTDMTQWLWGSIHTLTLMNLLNSAGNLFPQINLPSTGKGYPRPGSNYTVDPGELGANDIQMNYPTDYTYSSGPAIRFSVQMKPGDITAFNVLPGGESGLGPDLDNPPKHYGDQANLWVNNQEHPLWFYPKDILKNAESRVIFQPQ